MSLPIKLRRLYASKDKTGDFVIVAEPLPAWLTANMTDLERIERREREQKAIEAEWARIQGQS